MSAAPSDIAASRVRTVSLAVAGCLPALHALHYFAQPSLAATSLNPLNRLALLASVLFAGGIVALHASRSAPPSTVARLGIALEIIVAFALSLVETAVLRGPGIVGLGTSAVGPWVLTMGTFVPHPPGWVLWAGLTAASTWPVAYAINAGRVDLAPMPPSSAIPWLLLNYAWAFAAFLVSRALRPVPLTPSADNRVGGYRLVSRLGEGGMGEVWEASHGQLARRAAVKIIRPDVIEVAGRGADAAIARFRREAQIIARLQSPHTVYVYDFGVSDDGRFYYAMELLDGISLQSLVQTFGPLTPSRTVFVLRQVCESLHEAHEQGLVHRDLKPSNVMLCKVALSHDVVKVLDFGLAKNVADPSATQLTVVGTTTGTPGYMAPEVVLGEGPIDRRADIYGLGCLAYYLLTGSLVFDDANLTRLALKHVHDQPHRPSSRTSQALPTDLERLVLQCLEKRPEQRPSNADQLSQRLRECSVEPWSPADAAQWWRTYVPSTPSSSDARARSETPGTATPASSPR